MEENRWHDMDAEIQKMRLPHSQLDDLSLRLSHISHLTIFRLKAWAISLRHLVAQAIQILTTF